jgi:hypothetical protein
VFLNQIDVFHHSSGKVTPQAYIGPCCQINRQYKKGGVVRQSAKECADNSNSYPTDKDRPMIGGCMCLPEFRLLLPTSTTCMDVVGLGGEDIPNYKLKGRWHYVIDEEFAEGFASRGVFPTLH